LPQNVSGKRGDVMGNGRQKNWNAVRLELRLMTRGMRQEFRARALRPPDIREKGSDKTQGKGTDEWYFSRRKVERWTPGVT